MSKVHVQGLPSADTQNEPSNLVRQKEIKDRLLNGENLDVIPTATEDSEFMPASAPPSPVVHKNPLELLSDAISHIDSNEHVEVQGPFGKITFRAMHSSINEHGLAFIVKKDHMSYEPKVGTNLIIGLGNQKHEVVYAGGYFTFRQMPFTFISFVKITDDTDD